MKPIQRLILVLMVGMLLGACAARPAATAGVTPTADGRELVVNPAQKAAAAALAEQLKIPAGQISLVSAVAQDWPDGCLGLPNAEEMCAMHVVHGYRVVLKAADQTYTFRTDQTGEVVRLEKPAAAPSADPTLQPTPQSTAPETGQLPPAVLSGIAGELKVSVSDVQVLSVEPVDWPDACLGVSAAGQVCAQIITPGYRVVAQVGGKPVELHTNQDGTYVRRVAALPASTPALLEWTAPSGACPGASFTATQVTFAGPGCGSGGQNPAAFPAGQRTAEMAALAALYQPFTAETAAGKIVFNGSGGQIASPDEERSVAEWARLVADEAAGGRGSAAAGQAFHWRRVGGIAGFCDELTVTVSGFAYPTSCKDNSAANLGRVRLTAEQLHRLYAWVDGLKSFELDQSDPITAADGMSLRVTFSGAGSKAADQADQDAILAFGSELFAASTGR